MAQNQDNLSPNNIFFLHKELTSMFVFWLDILRITFPLKFIGKADPKKVPNSLKFIGQADPKKGPNMPKLNTLMLKIEK